MADSKEQKIIDAIVARMKLILTTGGYQTNIGARVEDSRPNWDEEANELPAISVFQGTTETQKVASENEKLRIHLMPVMIRCSLKRQDTAAADAAMARKAISDIFKAIRVDDRWKVNGVGLVMDTHQSQHAIEFAPDTFEITGVQVTIEIQYSTLKFNAET